MFNKMFNKMRNTQGVHLKSEWHPSLSAVFLRGELGGDAVDLDEDPCVPCRVPEEAHRVQSRRLLFHVRHPVTQRCVHFQDPLVWMSPEYIW